jgi:hypothetical protein
MRPGLPITVCRRRVGDIGRSTAHDASATRAQSRSARVRACDNGGE